MNVFSAMEITASGLYAQRTRMNTIASNLANARTTRTDEGGPYRRQDPVFRAVAASDLFESLRDDPAAQSAFLVEVPEIRADERDPQLVYDPGHPDADERGMVALPNVEVVEELVNMITASRAYEAGVTLLQTIKGMGSSALDIGA